MTRSTQKAKERAYLQIVQSRHRSFPQGAVSTPDEHGNAFPDFLVGDEFGVEIVELYSQHGSTPHSQKRLEALRSRIVEGAADQCRDLRGIVVSPSLCLTDVTKRDVDSIASALANAVRRNLPPLNSEWRGRWPRSHPERPHSALRGLSIHHFGMQDSLWDDCSEMAAYLRPLSEIAVQEVIDRKNEKLEQSDDSGREMWLIVAIDDRSDSGLFSIGPDCLSAAYETAYRGVYVATSFDRQAYRLNVVSRTE